MIRTLVLGCGSIGERHIRCLTRVGKAIITPVDARPERLQAMQELYGTEPGYSDYEQADLSDFDAVLICTPTDQHIPQALRATDAGCHVFVEKPISTDMTGVDDLIARCHKRQLVLQIGYVYRHHPLMAEMHEVIASGDLGAVRLVGIKSGYAVERARPDFRSTYWTARATGGGVYYDASHQFDYIQALISPITAVTALSRHFEFDVDRDVEDTGLMLIEFASGAVGTISLNHFQRNPIHRTELVCTKGTAVWEVDRNQTVVYRDADRSWHRHRLEMERDDWYVPQAASFLGAVRGENPVVVTGEDGKRALRVALAALESAKTKQRVEIV